MDAESRETRGHELFGLNTFFGIAVLLTILLRCYTRAAIIKAFGLDDWLMVLATAFFGVYCCTSNSGVYYGTGQHMANLKDADIKKAMMYWWFCYLFYSLTMISSKLSIAWFLLRLTARRIQSWVIYCASLLSVLAGIVFFFVSLFQCKPISFFWDKDQPGTCIKVDVIIALAYLYSAFSVLTDFTFALLPGFLIWNLKLNKRTKLALITLITMGCVASSALLIRFGYLMRFRDPDFLWATFDIAIWSTVEMGLAITAGSLATLRPLAKMLRWKLGLTSLASRGNSTNRGVYGATGPLNQVPSRVENAGQSDQNVYVLSEFSQDSQHLELGLPRHLGIQATVCADFLRGKRISRGGRPQSGNESQEQLHRPRPKEPYAVLIVDCPERRDKGDEGGF